MDLPVDDNFEHEWRRMTVPQKQYIMARQHTTTKAEAAREAGLEPATVYSFDAVVDELVHSVADHRAMIVRDALADAAVEAAQTMVDLLGSSSDSVRARAAEYIIDQTTGKATQHIEQETKQVNSVQIEILNPQGRPGGAQEENARGEVQDVEVKQLTTGAE